MATQLREAVEKLRGEIKGLVILGAEDLGGASS